METENKSCQQNKVIYNLAIKKKALNSTNIKNDSTIEKEQGSFNERVEKNIFRGEILEKMKDFRSYKSYNVIGKKEIRAYHYRNTKKKGAFKRADSARSNSKQSNTAQSQDTDNNLYLTKDQLLDTLHQSGKEQSYLQKKKCPALEKVKLQYKKYRTLWADNNLKSMENQKRQNISKIVDCSRQKQEKRELATLKQKKENIPTSKWKETLRLGVDLMHYYDQAYVQHIMKNGFTVNGKSKKEKQVEWVANISNAVFQFCEKKDNINRSLQEKLTNA